MTAEELRRERLNQVLDLARIYRGWTKAELAASLGRDPARLAPESGNPKLDMVVGLADTLDWAVGDLVEALWRQDEQDLVPSVSFRELDDQAIAAHRGGDYAKLLDLSKQLRSVARSPKERAIAANRAAGAYDALGRYQKGLEALQDGLSEPDLDPRVRIMLQTNLANAHYSLWHLVEASATARDLLEGFVREPASGRGLRACQATAQYVLGNCERRTIPLDPERRHYHAMAARSAFEQSIRTYSDLADEFGDPSYVGTANTCRGGIIEADATLGSISPKQAVELLADGLNHVVDVAGHPKGDLLESWGWWSVFGCNVSLRFLSGDDLHLAMALFSNKAMEIADRLDNWSMRERAFTVEHFRRMRVPEATDIQQEWVLDREDIRTLAGTMGRFPHFRPIGWKILEKARIVES